MAPRTVLVAAGLALALSLVLCVTAHREDEWSKSISGGERAKFTNGSLDLLLFHDSVMAAGIIFVVRDDYECYPRRRLFPGYYYDSNVTITAFNISNLVPYDNGGYVRLAEGDVGWRHVCFQFKSQRGKNMHFDVKVYGYYNTNSEM